MKLTINDVDYTLEWGMGCIEIYCDNMDCDVGDIDIHLSSEKLIDQMKAINNLVLAAIQNGCENQRPKQDFDLDYRGLQRWLDTQPQSVASDIIADWKKSYLFGTTVAEYFFGEVEQEVADAVGKAKKKPRSEKS